MELTPTPANEAVYAAGFTLSDLEEIMYESVAVTLDGCTVEPDGECPHGFVSPLLTLGFI